LSLQIKNLEGEMRKLILAALIALAVASGSAYAAANPYQDWIWTGIEWVYTGTDPDPDPPPRPPFNG
jgi:hypothetical protein